MYENQKLPAFPTHVQPGLSKREIFVKDILAGVMANTQMNDCDFRKAARLAIEQADTALLMLEEIPFGTLSQEAAHVDN